MSIEDSLPEFIQASKPIRYEAVVVIGITFLLIWNTTQMDINIHKAYVGVNVEICYPENQSPECRAIREATNACKFCQIEIGQVYWDELFRQAIVIGAVAFMFRFGIAVLLYLAQLHSMRPMSVFMASLYGVIAIGLFMFGFLDLFYYLMQGENVPETLDWLDGAGVFTITKAWFGTAEHVEIEDLVATNLVGLLFFAILILVSMFMYAESGLSSDKGIA